MKRTSSLAAVLAACIPALAGATDSAARKLDERFSLPGEDSQLELSSIPNARCDLHAPGDAERSLEVFSNDEGVIKVRARLDFGQVPVDLTLDCEGDDGVSDSRTVRFRPGHAAAARKHALIMGLAGDPMHLSRQELHAQGYPQRPEPGNAARMQEWLDAISRPARKVSPRRVKGRTQNGQTIVNETTNNWSGFMIEPKDGAKLTLVEGGWVVPTITWADRPAPWLKGRQFSSTWVGLDSGPGIFQAGTQHNVTIFLGIMMTTYNAWIEVFPGPIEALPDFTVSPGDHVLFRVFSVKRNGERDDQGDFMGFDFDNYAPPLQSTSGDVFAQFAGFTGSTAEWIVERQTPVDAQGVAQPLRPLPDYGITNITGASALDSSGRRHDLFTTSDILHKMVMLDFDVSAAGALTSAIQRTGRSSMKFTWVDPLP
ncbi:MAG: G1 family glutamic endopeptidase [Pseudomonadota bacterium]